MKCGDKEGLWTTKVCVFLHLESSAGGQTGSCFLLITCRTWTALGATPPHSQIIFGFLFSEEESHCWYPVLLLLTYKFWKIVLILRLQQFSVINYCALCISWAFFESLPLKSTRPNKLESAQITSRPKSCVMPKVWVVGEGGGGGGMRKPSHQLFAIPFANLITILRLWLVDLGKSGFSFEKLVKRRNLTTNWGNSLVLHQILIKSVYLVTFFK